MTLPSAAKPALIEIPSLARSPEAPVFFSRSLPAKSTKCSLLSTVTVSPALNVSTGIDMRFSFIGLGVAWVDADLRCTRFKLKTACDRDDLALIAVESV